MKRSLFFLFLFFPGLFSCATEWQPYSFVSTETDIYCASSELDKPAGFTTGRYSPSNLLDRDPRTAWVEGEEGHGEGSYVCIGLGSELKPFVVIANGYQKSHTLFLANNRVKTLKVTLYLGVTDLRKTTQSGFLCDAAAFPVTRKVKLEDREGYQTLPLPFRKDEIEGWRKKMFRDYVLAHKKELYKDKAYSWLQEFYFVRFEIASVYKGSKYDDTALSDLLFSNSARPAFLPKNEKVLVVLESDNEGEILVRTESGHVYTLDSISREELLNGSVLGVADVSPDKKWAVVIETSGGAGRNTEENYKLFYIPLLEEVDVRDLYDQGQPLGFEEKNGKLYIVMLDGEVLAEETELDLMLMHEFPFLYEGDTVALPLLFADAIERHDINDILACMDDNYLYEQLESFHKNDTIAFLNEQFCGTPPSGGTYTCIDLKDVSVDGQPTVVQRDDSSWELKLPLTDGKKKIEATWTILEEEWDDSEYFVFGVAGAAG